MSPKISSCAGFLLTLWVCFTASAGAQGSSTLCVVHVTRPDDGQEVGGHVDVEGTAEIPPNHHLWVFARHVSFRTSEGWWPQSEGLVDPETQKWKARAVLGEARDIGDAFDLAVAVFASEQHQQLAAYLQKARETNEFRPIQMPATACVPVLRVLKKISHH